MVTYIFPGQGSQFKGMGRGLFDEFSDLTAKADRILGYSIKELCLRDPNNQLSKTQYTQPAIYTVNVLTYLKKLLETEKKPDYVAGHSLGEYSALFAANVFDFETGLKLVKKRGELMSQVSNGSMAAVLGLKEEKIEEIKRNNNLETIDIANYNSPVQTVISGPREDIEKAASLIENAGGMFFPLPVSGAFHSRYMRDAKKIFEEYLSNFVLSDLNIPVISNVTARPHEHEKLKENLALQITHPVKWTESVRYLLGLGEMVFEEIGYGDVLTKMVEKIREIAEPLQLVEDTEDNRTEIEHQQIDKFSLNHQEISEQKKTIEKDGKFAGITGTSLGDDGFKKDYNLRYAYLTGGMYRGIASERMIVKIGKAGMMGFFGSGGLDLSRIENAIQHIQRELYYGQAYGINLVHNPSEPQYEEKIVDLILKYGVKTIEAAAFMSITSALVYYHAKGLKRDKSGDIISSNRIIAKISRPEVAEAFLSPAPEHILKKLLSQNKITPEEAEFSKEIPIADDICVEADSGGHTDGGLAYALMPAIIKLRDEMLKKHQYVKKIRIGAAGGIGTPEAAAAAFILGADFILTGSINQCTVEAATSNKVKDLLQQMNVQDTEYAPAGDMFELGAKVQVLKKGVFFPARANKLYELYRHYNSLDDIDEKTKMQIQDKYFKRTFEDVYQEINNYYSTQEMQKAESNPKHMMALIFRWYFNYSSQLAISGDVDSKVDYQIHCGPALGAFNQWVKGTDLENWENRHVDVIGTKLMEETADLLNQRFRSIFN